MPNMKTESLQAKIQHCGLPFLSVATVSRKYYRVFQGRQHIISLALQYHHSAHIQCKCFLNLFFIVIQLSNNTKLYSVLLQNLSCASTDKI